jgi:hypothetical protein
MAPNGGMAGVLPPPRAPGVQETHVNINLDGYRLGEAVACHVARTNQHRGGTVRCWRDAHAGQSADCVRLSRLGVGDCALSYVL